MFIAIITRAYYLFHYYNYFYYYCWFRVIVIIIIIIIRRAYLFHYYYWSLFIAIIITRAYYSFHYYYYCCWFIKVHFPDGDTYYFDIVAGMLQGDTLASYLFSICLDYVLRTSIGKIKENSFKLTKERSRRYPAKTITIADYTDDIVFLANAPTQTETLLHSLEWAAAGIGLYVNAHKMEYMYFNQQVTSPH